MPSRRSASTKVALFLVLAVTVLSRGPAVRAQPAPPITFIWNAPPPCPSSAAVLAETTRLLGGRVEGDRRVDGRATVRKAFDGWHLALTTTVDGTPGRRTLVAPTCEDAADAAALILALAFDPDAVVAGPAPPPKPPPPPPQPPPPPPPPGPPPPPEDETDDAIPIGGSFAALINVDAGVLPNVGVGFGGAAALHLGPVRLELAGSYWLPQTVTLNAAGAGGEVSYAAGSLSACPGFRADRLYGGGCAGIELGWLGAEAIGVDVVGEADQLWASARLGALGAVRLGGPVWLRLELGVTIPFTRPRFRLERVPEAGGVVNQPGIVSARAAGGLEVAFFP